MADNPDRERPVHCLFIGSRDGEAFSDEDREAVAELIGQDFDCFTMIDAAGRFRDRNVATLVVKIATDEGAKVTATALRIGRHLSQQAIGLEVNGYYRSIRVD